MSSSTAETEISEEILTQVVPGVLIHVTDPRVPEIKFEATVQDLRDALKPLGLDVTTQRALNWGIANPVQAAHIDTIIELQQETDELQARLDERNEALEGTFPQDPGKRAAE